VLVTATSVSDTTKSASATLTITTAPTIGVTVNPPTSTVSVGGTQVFSATVSNDPQNKGVTWTLSGVGCTSNTNLCGKISATFSASGQNITYMAPATAPSPMAVTLTATSVADVTKSEEANITVSTMPVLQVLISPATANVPITTKQKFTATVRNDAKNQGVTWQLLGSACEGVASLTTCGVLSNSTPTATTYSAPNAVPVSGPPTITLQATSVSDPTQTGSALITITAPGNVTLTPGRGGVPISQALNFTAAVLGDTNNQGVTWSVTGSNCSGAACGTFTGVTTPSKSATYNAPATAGVYTITATSVGFPGQSASATIGVTDLPGVFTYHNDLSRDGVNTQEYALTTSTVANSTFGKLFACPVDGAIYTQPLWVPGLHINGGTHNVIFVATEHDSLYAFDADANPCLQLWQVSLIDQAHGGTAGEGPVPTGTNLYYIGQGAGDIMPEVGVTGSPVIDPSTNTLYVVSKSVIISGPTFFQRLHAIDLTTGLDKYSPVAISASVPGNAPDAVNGVVSFNPGSQNQRPSLAFVNGVVYIAWASHEDEDPWHGWIIGYAVVSNALAQVGIFNTTPNTVNVDGAPATYARGGIWMSGGAPAADTNNNLFLITGNGSFDGVTNFGDSLLKLSTSSGLSLLDWFTPSDQAQLNDNDLDFGSGGAVVLVDMPLAPVPHLLLGGGKQGSGQRGEIFLLNRDALGNMTSTDGQVLQKFAPPTPPAGSPSGCSANEIFSTPAFWNNTLYVTPVCNNVLSFSFDPVNLFNTSPTQSTSPSSGFGFPGATPSISASGGTNGIVWVLDNSLYCTPQSPPPTFCGPTVLHAYDASNLKELWNSSQAANARDQAGFAVKFTVPTIANGRVYVGTRGADGTAGAIAVTGGTGELDVYGLLPN
jgi:hypothetical protein